jgi:tRNA dimethylallyltransferase
MGGEIISADSMQVYRNMDIGTAKPTPDQQCRVPHHLIDIVNPDESFNAACFMERARAVIAELHKRGKKIIVVGGTGFTSAPFWVGFSMVRPRMRRCVGTISQFWNGRERRAFTGC